MKHKLMAMTVAMIFIFQLFAVMSVSAQPTGLISSRMIPTADGLAGWTLAAGDATTAYQILRPSSDVVKQFTTVEPPGGGTVNITAEAWFNTDGGGTGHGTGYTSKPASTYQRIIYYRWDVAGAIGTGMTITSATMHVYISHYTSSGSTSVKRSAAFANDYYSYASRPAEGTEYDQWSYGSDHKWYARTGMTTIINTMYGTDGHVYFCFNPTRVTSDDTSYVVGTNDGALQQNDCTIEVTYTDASPAHYVAVDETTAGGDGSTSYVSDASGHADRYGFTDLSAISGLVAGSMKVTVWCVAVGSSGVDRYGLSDGSSSYYYDPATGNNSHQWTTNPFTSSDWTEATINALTPYIEATAGTLQVTQMGMLVEYQSTISATHYNCVDETSSDSDTSYVQTTSASVYDRYTMSDPSTIGTYKNVNSLTVWAIAKRLATGNSNLKVGVYIGSTYYEGVSATLTNSYANYSYTWTVNPATSAAWSITELNALVTYISTNDVTQTPRVTMVNAMATFNYGWQATFTSTPVTSIVRGKAYSYDANINETVNGFYLSGTCTSFLSIVLATGVVSGTAPATDGTYTVVINATSTAGLQNNWQNYTLTVTHWHPTFTSTQPTGTHAGLFYPNDAYSYTITNNETCTRTNLAKPSWLTFTSANATLWGRIPIATPAGANSVSTQAQSTAGDGYAWQNYSITVTNTAPTYSSSPVTTVHWSTNYYYDVNAADPEGMTITYARTTNWTVAIDSSTGELTKAQPHTINSYWIDVTADDGYYHTHQSFTVTVTNVAPSISSSPVTTCSWNHGYFYNVTATSGDADILYYDIATDFTGSAIDHGTGAITNPAPNTNGTYYMHVSVYDGLVTVWQNYSITVTNLAPSITSSPTLTIQEYGAYSYILVGSDPEGTTLTYACTQKPAFLTFSTGNQTLWGRPVLGDRGTYSVKLTVYDGDKYAYQNYSLVITPTKTVLHPDADLFISWSIRVPSTPTTHWDKLQTNDGNTSYVATLHETDSELYGLEDSTYGGTIAGIQLFMWLRGAVPLVGVPLFYYWITDGVSATAPAPLWLGNYPWQNFTTYWATNPFTSLPWTLANVNALRIYLYSSAPTYCTETGIIIWQTTPPLPPQFTTYPVTSGTGGVAYSYDADTNLPPVTFSLDTGTTASFLTVDPATGVVSGTPTIYQCGIWEVDVKATGTIGGLSGWQNYTLNITDPIAPVANAGADFTVDIFAPMTFDGSASTDNMGVTNWTWTFTDGIPQTLYGDFASYAFTTSGVKTVTLTVYDYSGNSDTDTVVVTVTPNYILLPEADVGASSISTYTLRPDGKWANGMFMNSVFPASPITHYDKVDEVTSDGDATYIRCGNVNLPDRFSVSNQTLPAGSIWVSISIVARMEAWTATVGIGIYNGTAVGNTYPTLYHQMKSQLISSTSYATYSTAFTDINPHTGVAWTQDDITWLRPYIVEISGSGWIRFTQVYVTVKVVPATGGWGMSPSDGIYWDKLNEKTPDGMTTHIYQNSYNTELKFNMTDFSDGGWTYRLVMFVVAEKQTSNPAQFDFGLLYNGTEYYGDTAVIPDLSGWEYYNYTWTLCPWTGGAWNTTTISEAQTYIHATVTTGNITITQLGLFVARTPFAVISPSTLVGSNYSYTAGFSLQHASITIHFNALSSGTLYGITAGWWELRNNTNVVVDNGAGLYFNHTFDEADGYNYTLYLTVTDAGGSNTTHTHIIIVPQVPPVITVGDIKGIFGIIGFIGVLGIPAFAIIRWKKQEGAEDRFRQVVGEIILFAVFLAMLIFGIA